MTKQLSAIHQATPRSFKGVHNKGISGRDAPRHCEECGAYTRALTLRLCKPCYHRFKYRTDKKWRERMKKRVLKRAKK
jgi:hypothetical protein